MDTAMIFAAGRGERMRPLTDHTPKPLLEVGGKALIVWQIEALARAGIKRIVINHAWLGAQIETALGDGSQWGVALHYSREGGQALETAGGIAHALPLLRSSASDCSIFIAVSGDVFTDFDYGSLHARAEAMRAQTEPTMHLVMVPNPPYHSAGDFFFDHDQLCTDGTERLTFANIGLYDSRTFMALAADTPPPRMPLGPLFREAIAAGRVSAERWDGVWANVGTPGDLATLDAALRNPLDKR